MAMTKKAKALAAAVDREKLYSIDEALGLVKSLATAKFDETIEVSLNLGVDPRHADQMVRGVVTLPKGTGKTVRVGVFARGAKACLLYTSPSPRDQRGSRMPSSA